MRSLFFSIIQDDSNTNNFEHAIIEFDLDWDSLPIYFVPDCLQGVNVIVVLNFPWIRLECCIPDKRRNKHFLKAIVILGTNREIAIFGPNNRFLGAALLDGLGVVLNVLNIYYSLKLMSKYNLTSRK